MVTRVFVVKAMQVCTVATVENMVDKRKHRASANLSASTQL